jgi:hypothetical protein
MRDLLEIKKGGSRWEQAYHPSFVPRYKEKFTEFISWAEVCDMRGGKFPNSELSH